MKIRKLNESYEQITFDSLDNYKNERFYRKSNIAKRYFLVGKFVGYDGVEYVALETANAFADKSYIRFETFVKNYVVFDDDSPITYRVGASVLSDYHLTSDNYIKAYKELQSIPSSKVTTNVAREIAQKHGGVLDNEN